MMTSFFYRSLRLFVPVFFLVGCIAVDDFGAYWDKGFIDSCVNEIVISQQHHAKPTEKPEKHLLLRSLRIKNHTFLMMRDDIRTKGGNLVLYKIDGDDYISYRLNESMREQFLSDFPNSGLIITHETATIPVLTEEKIDLLLEIADDENYWVESHREAYNPRHRKDCIHTLF